MLIRVLAAASAAAFLLSGPVLAHPGGLDSWSEYRDAKLPTIYEHPQQPDILTAATVEGLATRARIVKQLRAEWREFDAAFWAGLEPEPVNHIHSPEPVVAATANWDAVAACESGGRWDLVTTGNGYYFALQFSPSTWTGYGGDPSYLSGPAPPRSTQIAVAERVLEGQGPGAWPNCFSW